MNHQITILMATYNGKKYISQQLDSILSQTYPTWKIIISDDMSIDGTREILDLYREKYPEKIITLQKSIHFGSARDNFLYLMKHAETKYLMFCDQDDIWEKNKILISLEKMIYLENQFGEDCPILIHTDLEVVDANLNRLASSFMKYSNLDSKRTKLNQLLIQNIVTGCTVMINSTLNKLALNYQDQRYILMHDWWLALTASIFGHIDFINISTVKYRQHNSNSVGAKNIRNIDYINSKIFENNNIRSSIITTTQQANQFLVSYADKIPAEYKKLLKNYANLYNNNKIFRIVYMFKCKVFKYGIMRKIAQILWG